MKDASTPDFPLSLEASTQNVEGKAIILPCLNKSHKFSNW